MVDEQVTRCTWAKHELELVYHDTEWGVPVHEDRKHFEFIVLDGVQAGLSWLTVLKKRENYRKAMDNFDPVKVARYDDTKIQQLLQDPGLVRNKLKMAAAVTNAQAFLKIQEAYGSFDEYIWQFVDGKTRVNQWQSHEGVPATSSQSDAMSKDLKKRGFKFVGSTICYAYMQAAGMVNDHLAGCFRYKDCRKN